MVSALGGSGGYAKHCKNSKVLTKPNEDWYYCSICEKKLKLVDHWYGRKLHEIE